MPLENKFPSRAHAENRLSVQTKFDSPPPLSESNIAFQRPQSITDKLSVAHCALRVAPFTTSRFADLIATCKCNKIFTAKCNSQTE